MNNPNQLQDDPSMAKWHRIWMARTVHPNLKIDFFETIDTKEKAYWLGFLYADGYLVELPNKAEIRLKLKIRDEDTVNRFCDTLQLNKDKKEYITDEGGHRQAMIRFGCKKMSDDLIRNDLTFRESETIQLPNLPQADLELAFLLGYYDGDGRRHTTLISSGSIQFLEQVKERYKLPYKIYVDKRGKEIYGRKLNSINYMLHLGPELFNRMIRNHANSMQRKRWTPRERKERMRRARKACTLEEVQKRTRLQREWKMLTKEKLEGLVRTMPLKEIAARYNVSRSPTVARKCRKYGIPMPERGYWTKIYWSRAKSIGRKASSESKARYQLAVSRHSPVCS